MYICWHFWKKSYEQEKQQQQILKENLPVTWIFNIEYLDIRRTILCYGKDL